MAQPSRSQRSQSIAVINLTEEPDSPVDPQPPSQIGRNIRRTHSQRITAPRLRRSDSLSLGPEASDIGQTTDERVPTPGIIRGHQHHHRRPRTIAPHQLIELTAGSSFYSDVNRGVRRMADLLDTNFMMRGFNATLSGFPPNFIPKEPSPKPPIEQSPPTRDSFTRDTSSTEERVVVCPACNDELAYDPMNTTQLPNVTFGTGRKRKRAPGEHHLWALKKCGHVYCADCFQNRRLTGARPLGVGFRWPPGETPNNVPKDIRCAVEECETKVACKTEWVGIYL